MKISIPASSTLKFPPDCIWCGSTEAPSEIEVAESVSLPYRDRKTLIIPACHACARRGRPRLDLEAIAVTTLVVVVLGITGFLIVGLFGGRSILRMPFLEYLGKRLLVFVVLSVVSLPLAGAFIFVWKSIKRRRRTYVRFEEDVIVFDFGLRRRGELLSNLNAEAKEEE